MNNLKFLRESRGYTQAQLAGKVGVSQQAVGKWERGESDPQWDLAPRLAEALECKIDMLFWPLGQAEKGEAS